MKTIELVNVDKNQTRPAPFYAYKVLVDGKEFSHVVSIRFEISTQNAFPYVEIVYMDDQKQEQTIKEALSSVIFSAEVKE